jgi:hypothetical protein
MVRGSLVHRQTEFRRDFGGSPVGLLFGSVTDLEEMIPDLISERFGFPVIGSQMNNRLGFDFRSWDQLAKQLDQFRTCIDRPASGNRNVAYGPLRGNLKSIDSVHDRVLLLTKTRL